jgi:hypothetical protein
MVCLGNICINTLQKEVKDDNDDDNNNNNNNNNQLLFSKAGAQLFRVHSGQ